MHFVIDRTKWARGKRINKDGLRINNTLLGKDGMQCCIGQVCSQLGKRDNELLCQGGVLSVRNKDGLLNFWDWQTNNTPEFVDACYGINDDDSHSDSARERLLTEKFASAGHTIEFIN